MTAFDHQSVSAYLGECVQSAYEFFKLGPRRCILWEETDSLSLRIVPNVFSGVFYLFAFVLKKQLKHLRKYNLLWVRLPAAPPPHVLQRSCPPEQLSRLLTQALLPNSPSLKDLFVYFLHNSHMYLYAEQVMGRFYHPLLSTLAAQNDKVSLCVAAEGLPGSRKTLAINLHRTARTKIQNPISLMFALAELQYGFGVFLPNSEKVLLGRRLEKATYNSQCECCWKANFKKSELVL